MEALFLSPVLHDFNRQHHTQFFFVRCLQVSLISGGGSKRGGHWFNQLEDSNCTVYTLIGHDLTFSYHHIIPYQPIREELKEQTGTLSSQGAD